jgi:hypothetical protein
MNQGFQFSDGDQRFRRRHKQDRSPEQRQFQRGNQNAIFDANIFNIIDFDIYQGSRHPDSLQRLRHVIDQSKALKAKTDAHVGALQSGVAEPAASALKLTQKSGNGRLRK